MRIGIVLLRHAFRMDGKTLTLRNASSIGKTLVKIESLGNSWQVGLSDFFVKNPKSSSVLGFRTQNDFGAKKRFDCSAVIATMGAAGRGWACLRV